MKNLVIVESPAKAKTINNYLGRDYQVVASFGHVRDLPKHEIGVDVDNNFAPTYRVIAKSRKVLSHLKKLSASADVVYLATDLDREGEAISWHIAQALGLKDGGKIKRIVFPEITKSAIQSAILNPRQIDMDLVNAQQARRVIDRLVGYNLSPLLWKKVMKGLSAGRVQSVAVRLIVEREREIEGFKPQEYWQITAKLQKEKNIFDAKLVELSGRRIDKLSITSKEQADKISKELAGGKYQVESVERMEQNRYPQPPFTTSTMQQEAANRLGFSAKQTMRTAQLLYEAGKITYMRTDSVNMSAEALSAAREQIEKKFGKSYLSGQKRVYRSKARLAQEAHEAIRPTDFGLSENDLNVFDDRAKKLYWLIWKRAIASQMKEATLAIIEAKISCNNYLFQARGQTIKFDGFLKVYPDKVKEVELPNLTSGDILSLVELLTNQHFTQPPARYSEATLIKTLEEKGIGRPSTYAPTISTIQDRGYVEKEKGRLKPKKIGFIVNDLLVENFPDIVDYEFTASIEEDLDRIAAGKVKWQEPVRKFYQPFNRELEEKAGSIKKQDLSEKLDEKCPKCGRGLVQRYSKHGKFIGCSGFPECKFSRPYISDEQKIKVDIGEKQVVGRKCPRCQADLKVVSGKYGPFIGCNQYPKCNYIERINVDNSRGNKKSD